MCTPPPPVCGAVDSDRFYKFGTPSPPSVPEYSPSCYSELEESGFRSDEEIQKVRIRFIVCCKIIEFVGCVFCCINFRVHRLIVPAHPFL